MHGNHAMSRPSEPGYAYLGEHLASQGYVVAAIDQNFLNGLFFFDGQFEEMPLRAWLGGQLEVRVRFPDRDVRLESVPSRVP